MSDKKLEKYEWGYPEEEEKGGIHLGSPGVPTEKAVEALHEALSSESRKEGEPYEFLYVSMSEVSKHAQPGIIFDWGCKKVGFGQITIVTDEEGKLRIDDECMSKKFIKEMFSFYIDEYYKKEGH